MVNNLVVEVVAGNIDGVVVVGGCAVVVKVVEVSMLE